MGARIWVWKSSLLWSKIRFYTIKKNFDYSWDPLRFGLQPILQKRVLYIFCLKNINNKIFCRLFCKSSVRTKNYILEFIRIKKVFWLKILIFSKEIILKILKTNSHCTLNFSKNSLNRSQINGLNEFYNVYNIVSNILCG